MHVAISRRPAVTRRAAVAGEFLAREWLVHHAKHRLAEAHQPDQRAPGWHAGNEGFGAVDRIKHPDIFCVGAFSAVFLANDAMTRKIFGDERAHGLLGSSVGRGYRIEAAGFLIVDRQRRAEERQDGFARYTRELIDEACEIDGRHAALPCFAPTYRRAVAAATAPVLRPCCQRLRFSAALHGGNGRQFRMDKFKVLILGLSYAPKAWDMGLQALIFVRCGVFYCNAVARAIVALLGVSSLDLGRSHVERPLFLLFRRRPIGTKSVSYTH